MEKKDLPKLPVFEKKDSYTLEDYKNILTHQPADVFDGIEWSVKRRKFVVYEYNDHTDTFKKKLDEYNFDYAGSDDRWTWYAITQENLDKFINECYDNIRIYPGDPLTKRCNTYL